jgi:hypothetical protein
MGRIQLAQPRLVERHLVAGVKQNDAPVELPNHVLVGTSTNGERRPPTTLPNWSSTAAPFGQGSDRHGAVRCPR